MKNKKSNISSLVTRHSSPPKGFTLIEMIVTMTIIGFLASIGLSSYGNLKRRYEFENAMNHIVEMIKTARNYAMTSKAVYNRASPQKPIIPKEGYGVFFNKSPGNPTDPKVVLFANNSIQGNNLNSFDQNDIVLEKYQIPKGIVFDRLGSKETNEGLGMPDVGIDLGNTALILFHPPLAETFIGKNSLPDSFMKNLSIQLYQQEFPAKKKVITIDSIGGFPLLHL